MTKKNNKMASYILVKLGLLLAIIALLGQIISVALPWWTYKEVEILGSMYRYHNGLWETCIELDTSVGKAISCSDITDPTGSQKCFYLCISVSFLYLFFRTQGRLGHASS